MVPVVTTELDMNCDTTGSQSSIYCYVRGIAVICKTYVQYMQDSKCIVATCVSRYRKYILHTEESYLHVGSLSAVPCSLASQWMVLLTEV